MRSFSHTVFTAVTTEQIIGSQTRSNGAAQTFLGIPIESFGTSLCSLRARALRFGPRCLIVTLS